MLDSSTIALISFPLILIGLLGIIFCFVRDYLNIKKNRGRANNTAPEIYWFMMVLIVVGLFFALDWKFALLITITLILIFHPIRKKTKLKKVEF